MTIRFIQQWNGHSPDEVNSSLGSTEEARLVGLNLASYDLDGANDGAEEFVKAKRNLLTGRIEEIQGVFTADQLRVARKGRKLWDGARRQLTSGGYCVKNFTTAEFSVRTGTPTLSDVSSVDMPSPTVDGMPSAVKLIAGSAMDEIQIADESLADFAIDNMIGLLVYCKGCPGKAVGTSGTPAINLTFGTSSGTSYTGANVAVSWNTNQLREGYNFLVWKPAADVHPFGTYVTDTGGSLSLIRSGTTVKKIILSASNWNVSGAELYYVSLYNGLKSKGAVVFNCDAAGPSLRDVVVPYFSSLGWTGSVFSAYDSSSTKTITELFPISYKEGNAVRAYAYASGWEVCPHTMTHRDMSAMTDMSTVRAELVLMQNVLLAMGYVRGNNYYAAPKNKISTESFNAMSPYVVVQRGSFHQNVQPAAWGIENAHIGSTGWENRTLAAAWLEIKTLLDYGAMCCIGFHDVITENDPSDGTRYGTGSESAQWWSVAKTIIDNIKALELSGEVIVFRGFDDYCYGIR